MPTTALTPQQRRLLRARAHALHPVVQIAANGLSATVLAELERSLQAHELIKIKTRGAEREQRQQWLQQICQQLHAQPVQHIGNILLIWRQRRDDKAAPSTPPASKKTPPSSSTPPRRPATRSAPSRSATERYRPARANTTGSRRAPTAPRRRTLR